MGTSPRTSSQIPGRIALVDESDCAATSALLADAAEALPVYARLAGTQAPELVRTCTGRDVASCDTALLALKLDGTNPRVEELPISYAPTGARVYALLCTEGDPGVATYLLAELDERCEELGLRWCGGLAVGDADLLPRITGCPRMGWARRRVSEAVDELLISLLANKSVGERYVRPSRYARLIGRRR